jgi:hypothetical protein
MSLVYLDSCGDFYTTSDLSRRFDVVTGSPTVSNVAGRREGGGIILSGTGDRLQKNIPALTTYVVGIAFKLDTLVATDILSFKEGSTVHIIVRVTATGAIEVLRGPDPGTTISMAITDAGLVFSGIYSYLEAKILVDNASGTIDIDLNGTNELTMNTQDTANGGTPTIDNIEIEGSSGTLSIDDFYILNTVGAAPQNERLGDTRVDAVLPQADGATNNFPTLEPVTPTTSFDKVDDTAPDDDASYVGSDGSGDRELFDMADLPDPGGVSAIYSVQLNLLVRKDKTTARSVQGVVISDVTTDLGAVQATQSAYSYIREIWDEDPDTGPADWTDAGVNAAEFGMDIV